MAIKTMIIIVMALVTFDAFAVHKCEINGKVSYQNHPCINKSEQRKFEGATSVIGTVNVRKDLADKSFTKEVELPNKNITRDRKIDSMRTIE